MKARGSTAVMAQRHEPPDSLEFFPTPPWATRALLKYVVPDAGGLVWEPAAGEGHMAGVLSEAFDDVYRSDVFDYGGLSALGSFVGTGPDVIPTPAIRPDWIITNPPFALAAEFATRAIAEAKHGVALLLRTVWVEGGERYERLFRDRPPTIIAQFCERVPMTKGRWDQDASTATAYAWFVWLRAAPHDTTRFMWIPPGCRRRLEHRCDRARFAAPAQTVADSAGALA